MMTFEQYTNQPDPAKLGPGLVVVLESEVYSTFVVGEFRQVILYISGQYYPYVCDRVGGLMWTQDDQGNKKQRSVFTLILNQ